MAMKIVDFEWCNECIHKDKAETESPCDECLNEPANEDSVRPVKFKAKKED